MNRIPVSPKALEEPLRLLNIVSRANRPLPLGEPSGRQRLLDDHGTQEPKPQNGERACGDTLKNVEPAALATID